MVSKYLLALATQRSGVNGNVFLTGNIESNSIVSVNNKMGFPSNEKRIISFLNPHNARAAMTGRGENIPLFRISFFYRIHPL